MKTIKLIIIMLFVVLINAQTLIYPANTKVIFIKILDLQIPIIETEQQYELFIKLNKFGRLIPNNWNRFSGGALYTIIDGSALFMFVIKNKSIKTIAHESNHMANYIMKEFEIEDDEMESYLVGYITEKVYNRINDKNK